VVTTSTILAPLLAPPYTDEHPQPTYILLQNGLNVEVDLYHSLVKLDRGDPQIISTAVYIGANLLEPNVVEHNLIVSFLLYHIPEKSQFVGPLAQDRSTIGWYRFNDYTTTSYTPEQAARLSEVSGLLNAGGSQSVVVPEIQRAKFSKNFWNVAFSSLSTLTGLV
jgi:2-dehydropantoate 2-reductase